MKKVIFNVATLGFYPMPKLPIQVPDLKCDIKFLKRRTYVMLNYTCKRKAIQTFTYWFGRGEAKIQGNRHFLIWFMRV